MTRDELITAYAHLVPLTVSRAVPRIPIKVERDDLVAAGYLGLVQAANRFDPGRGTRFSSLAITWIRGSILDELRREDWAPRSLRAKQSRGEPVRIVEVVSLEGLTWDGLLDEPGDPRLELSRAEEIPDPSPGPEEQVLTAEAAAQVWAQVRSLEEREREVVTLYYGERITLREIGARLDRSETTAMNLRNAGLDVLRAADWQER